MHEKTVWFLHDQGEGSQKRSQNALQRTQKSHAHSERTTKSCSKEERPEEGREKQGREPRLVIRRKQGHFQGSEKDNRRSLREREATGQTNQGDWRQLPHLVRKDPGTHPQDGEGASARFIHLQIGA